ncbi:MAG: hypothetical protein IPM54_28965 [Polyangiaceae bacterium]|nr:hypothetical protein [Polyangiaceae bacterium]
MRHYATFGLLCSLFLPGIGGCGPDTDLVFGSSSTGAGGGGGSGGGSGACDSSRIDLVIAVDNSRGMVHKQSFLAEAIPSLLQGLTNPLCIDPNGVAPSSQPADPDSACPAGLVRAFPPQTDIHIGVVSSSLGGHGSDSCPDMDMQSCPGAINTSNNDRGHLLSRKNVCTTETIPTYANKSFLAWDPQQTLSPPGEATLDDGAGKGLVPTLKEMIKGVGDIGCGYESQLESVYRFLADPEPHENIAIVDFKAIPQGVDAALLSQRKDFLRPDSHLIVLMTSDENDCSTKEYGQFFLVNQLRAPNGTAFRMPRARQECATNPADPCCKSCGQAPGACPADPSCGDPAGPALYDEAEDKINLRCWDQKRRFGIDFLYPVDRYTQAFTKSTVTNRAGELVPNPIFTDLDPSDDKNTVREPSQVLVAGILGVPWQNIARDPKDAKKGYKDWKEMMLPAGGYATVWEVITGNPAAFVAPKDPLMNESVKPRWGTSPITGVTLASPMMPLGNSINGNEYTVTDDLQYACIFDLPEQFHRNCKEGNCECVDPNNDNPLCAENPDGSGRTLQVRARALPGLRQLSVLQGLGSQAAVGSACAAQTSDRSAPDFGYEPTMRSILDWFATRACVEK